MKIVSIKFESINIQIAVFITMLGIPTVILNGAFWEQCDVIYAALSLALLYYGFTSKSIKCFIFFGLAFSFKNLTKREKHQNYGVENQNYDVKNAWHCIFTIVATITFLSLVPKIILYCLLGS